MIIKESTLAVLSDMHTGGSTALFPRGGYVNGEGNRISPNKKQREIHEVFVRFAGEVRRARKGRRLIVVNLGDAIDGFHHNNLQECLFREDEQREAHLELMTDFLKRVGYGRGDELHYVKGTEVHVGDEENAIAKELRAVRPDTDEKKIFVNDVLTLNINGKAHVFAHHGKQRGGGQNEGNSLRNFLRDIRHDRNKDGLPQIDCLWSGHTHGHTWNTHIERRGSDFHEMHGVICPSWQAKTRYAYGKVPMAVNSVGGVYMQIGADGEMSRPRFVVQVTER